MNHHPDETSQPFDLSENLRKGLFPRTLAEKRRLKLTSLLLVHREFIPVLLLQLPQRLMNFILFLRTESFPTGFNVSK